MFAESEEQRIFEAATTRFLDAHPGRLGAKDWREAAALGWTTLLVPETAGGGSISGNGVADLLIVAFQFGRRAAAGPLFGSNLVAAALGRWASAEQQEGPLKELVAGDATAAWAHAATATATETGGSVVLDGRAPAVEGAADATYLLLTAGGSQYLVPRAADGVELTPLQGVDLARRFDGVTLHGVTVPLAARVGAQGDAEQHDAHLLDLLAVLLLGEMTGAMDRAFEMTLEWTANRYSFGRPLASYQEIKHRVADMRMHLEAAEAVTARAAHAVGTDAPDAAAWVSAGMTYVGRQAPEVIQDCIQLHGGIGVTFDHDLHLFLRRATLDANVFGAPSDFARRLGGLVVADQ